MSEIANKPENYNLTPEDSQPDSRLHTFIGNMNQLKQIYSVDPLEYTDIVGEYWQRINDIIYALGLTQDQTVSTNIGWTIPIIGKKRSNLVTEKLGAYDFNGGLKDAYILDENGYPIPKPSYVPSSTEYSLTNIEAPDSHLTSEYGTGKTEAHRYGLIQTIDWMFQRNINTWGDLYEYFYDNLNENNHPKSLANMIFGDIYNSNSTIDIDGSENEVNAYDYYMGRLTTSGAITEIVNLIDTFGKDFYDWLNTTKDCIFSYDTDESESSPNSLEELFFNGWGKDGEPTWCEYVKGLPSKGLLVETYNMVNYLGDNYYNYVNYINYQKDPNDISNPANPSNPDYVEYDQRRNPLFVLAQIDIGQVLYGNKAYDSHGNPYTIYENDYIDKNGYICENDYDVELVKEYHTNQENIFNKFIRLNYGSVGSTDDESVSGVYPKIISESTNPRTITVKDSPNSPEVEINYGTENYKTYINHNEAHYRYVNMPFNSYNGVFEDTNIAENQNAGIPYTYFKNNLNTIDTITYNPVKTSTLLSTYATPFSQSTHSLLVLAKEPNSETSSFDIETLYEVKNNKVTIGYTTYDAIKYVTISPEEVYEVYKNPSDALNRYAAGIPVINYNGEFYPVNSDNTVTIGDTTYTAIISDNEFIYDEIDVNLKSGIVIDNINYSIVDNAINLVDKTLTFLQSKSINIDSQNISITGNPLKLNTTTINYGDKTYSIDYEDTIENKNYVITGIPQNYYADYTINDNNVSIDYFATSDIVSTSKYTYVDINNETKYLDTDDTGIQLFAPSSGAPFGGIRIGNLAYDLNEYIVTQNADCFTINDVIIPVKINSTGYGFICDGVTIPTAESSGWVIKTEDGYALTGNPTYVGDDSSIYTIIYDNKYVSVGNILTTDGVRKYIVNNYVLKFIEPIDVYVLNNVPYLFDANDFNSEDIDTVNNIITIRNTHIFSSTDSNIIVEKDIVTDENNNVYFIKETKTFTYNDVIYTVTEDIVSDASENTYEVTENQFTIGEIEFTLDLNQNIVTYGVEETAINIVTTKHFTIGTNTNTDDNEENEELNYKKYIITENTVTNIADNTETYTITDNQFTIGETPNVITYTISTGVYDNNSAYGFLPVLTKEEDSETITYINISNTEIAIPNDYFIGYDFETIVIDNKCYFASMEHIGGVISDNNSYIINNSQFTIGETPDNITYTVNFDINDIPVSVTDGDNTYSVTDNAFVIGNTSYTFTEKIIIYDYYNDIANPNLEVLVNNEFTTISYANLYENSYDYILDENNVLTEVNYEIAPIQYVIYDSVNYVVHTIESSFDGISINDTNYRLYTYQNSKNVLYPLTGINSYYAIIKDSYGKESIILSIDEEVINPNTGLTEITTIHKTYTIHQIIPLGDTYYIEYNEQEYAVSKNNDTYSVTIDNGETSTTYTSNTINYVEINDKLYEIPSNTNVYYYQENTYKYYVDTNNVTEVFEIDSTIYQIVENKVTINEKVYEVLADSPHYKITAVVAKSNVDYPIEIKNSVTDGTNTYIINDSQFEIGNERYTVNDNFTEAVMSYIDSDTLFTFELNNNKWKITVPNHYATPTNSFTEIPETIHIGNTIFTVKNYLISVNDSSVFYDADNIDESKLKNYATVTVIIDNEQTNIKCIIDNEEITFNGSTYELTDTDVENIKTFVVPGDKYDAVAKKFYINGHYYDIESRNVFEYNNVVYSFPTGINSITVDYDEEDNPITAVKNGNDALINSVTYPITERKIISIVTTNNVTREFSLYSKVDNISNGIYTISNCKLVKICKDSNNNLVFILEQGYSGGGYTGLLTYIQIFNVDATIITPNKFTYTSSETYGSEKTINVSSAEINYTAAFKLPPVYTSTTAGAFKCQIKKNGTIITPNVYVYTWEFVKRTKFTVNSSNNMHFNYWQYVLPNNKYGIPTEIKQLNISVTDITKAALPELLSWEYNKEKNEIKSGVNSINREVLISNQKYKDYYFECIPYSNTNDDDEVGVVIATSTNYDTGLTHSLLLKRNATNLMLGIDKNTNLYTIGSNDSNKVRYLNGTYVNTDNNPIRYPNYKTNGITYAIETANVAVDNVTKTVKNISNAFYKLGYNSNGPTTNIGKTEITVNGKIYNDEKLTSNWTNVSESIKEFLTRLKPVNNSNFGVAYRSTRNSADKELIGDYYVIYPYHTTMTADTYWNNLGTTVKEQITNSIKSIFKNSDDTAIDNNTVESIFKTVIYPKYKLSTFDFNKITLDDLFKLFYAFGYTYLSLNSNFENQWHCSLYGYGWFNAYKTYDLNQKLAIDRTYNENTNSYDFTITYTDIFHNVHGLNSTNDNGIKFVNENSPINNDCDVFVIKISKIDNNCIIKLGDNIVKTISLSDYPDLKEMLTSSVSYGYNCQSNPLTAWKEVKFVDKSNNTIYNLENEKIYILNDNFEYVENTSSASNAQIQIFKDFGAGRFITNQITDKTFYSSKEYDSVVNISAILKGNEKHGVIIKDSKIDLTFLKEDSNINENGLVLNTTIVANSKTMGNKENTILGGYSITGSDRYKELAIISDPIETIISDTHTNTYGAVGSAIYLHGSKAHLGINRTDTNWQIGESYLPGSFGIVANGYLPKRDNNGKLIPYDTENPDETNYITASYGHKSLLGTPEGDLKWNGSALQITSDERKKANIGNVPDCVLDAWADINWVQFNYKEDLGRNGMKLHTGLIAQGINKVFEKHNLKATDYGLVTFDELSDFWNVRYEEALAMEAIYQRRRADMLEARIEKLEKLLKVK